MFIRLQSPSLYIYKVWPGRKAQEVGLAEVVGLAEKDYQVTVAKQPPRTRTIRHPLSFTVYSR